ncbi:DUF2513 domain-containing protein [Clostridium sp.]|uniref:DUF2513 domain-containing protein n=1 Tax=Clostridium sp. TaxID=1506 RepID=UPI002FDE3011
MKLNPDCIRDILLTVEETPGVQPQTPYPIDGEYERLGKYSKDEVLYHINQCELSDFFTEVSWFCGGSCVIHDLSPYGHEFLANIRSDTNWSKTKEIALKVGSFSLDALSKIATSVVSSLINNHF